MPASTADLPVSVPEAAELLRELGVGRRRVRCSGGGTKLGWLPMPDGAAVELSTRGLNRITEHNAGDFTAVVQAGVRLADLQAELAGHGQMLALDPPLGAGGGATATIGGVIATGDSGPLRHRYGGVRDLVLGITVALSDGTVARAGGKVIKNVAGYDLAKVFTGSWGTLGLVLEVAVRLHPLPRQRATAQGRFTEPGTLARAVRRLAAQPLEAECLDVIWGAGGGSLLVRFTGPCAGRRSQATAVQLQRLGAAATELIDDDEQLWAEARGRQRRDDGIVVKVAEDIAQLESVLAAAGAQGGGLVSRGGLGLSWISLSDGADLEARVSGLRKALPGAGLTVLDGAARIATPRPAPPPGAAVVMRRLKARFDPARIFPSLPELQ